MVERQLRRRGIEDERVLRAMEEVPRELFVPADVRSRAYRDGALPIGEGQTISQPWIVARMLALLELEGTERVLEVGTGSGYSAAVLSRCASHVVTVERHAALADRARATLAELGYRNVEVRAADGSIGQPDQAPFDAIVVTAAAASAPPPALLAELVPGGTLVCPVQGEDDDEQLVRVRDGETETIAAVRFVPLVEDGS
jgi:protein-L-isoaspartate(D-aspartate) O-methyltransferase